MVLTPRQQEVAGLVAKGMTARQIADRLGIAEQTVKIHIQDAAEQLPGETAPRHKLTLWFLQSGPSDAA